MIKDPPWLVEAKKHEGKKEVPGVKNNDWVIGLWDSIPWIWSTVIRKDDNLLPWCGAFIKLCLDKAGIKPPKAWYRAKAYIDFGTPIYHPAYGCIGVIKNAKGKYHVGIVIGWDAAGNIMLYGGNQNDMVRVSAFKFKSFVAFVWPSDDVQNIPMAGTLPILDADFSMSEA